MAMNEPTREQMRAFRDACGRFATGVTVICSKTPDGVHGMTANAFMSVSVSPFLVAISVTETARMHTLLAPEGACFSISILSKTQRHLSDAFAGKAPHPVNPRFKAVDNDQVVVDQAVAWMSCVKEKAITVADHTLIIGRVTSFGTTEGEHPLVFYGGAYYPGLTPDPDEAIEWVYRL